MRAFETLVADMGGRLHVFGPDNRRPRWNFWLPRCTSCGSRYEERRPLSALSHPLPGLCVECEVAERRRRATEAVEFWAAAENIEVEVKRLVAAGMQDAAQELILRYLDRKEGN